MIELDPCLALARLALRFGTINRATLHPDGETPESDTTHTCMLGLLAIAIAPLASQPLEPGLLASYALVHDLAEAYAGDTNTARALDAKAIEAKRAREAAALVRIAGDLAAYPWLLELLHSYEAQDVPEARFIRYLDKVLPKLTHVLNGGQALRFLYIDRYEATHQHATQGTKLRQEYPEFENLHALFDAASTAAEVELS